MAATGGPQSGDVQQGGQATMGGAQLPDGFALICSATPDSDVKIKTHQQEEMDSDVGDNLSPGKPPASA